MNTKRCLPGSKCGDLPDQLLDHRDGSTPPGPDRRQAASSEVEELIWQVAHFEPGKQRLVFMVDVGEPEPFGAAH